MLNQLSSKLYAYNGLDKIYHHTVILSVRNHPRVLYSYPEVVKACMVSHQGMKYTCILRLAPFSAECPLGFPVSYEKLAPHSKQAS